MPGSRGFLSVDRRSSGRPAACRGCWGVLRAVEDVRGHDAAALEHRGQRAARIVRPPSSRFVLPRAPPVGEAWQFSVKLQLAATAILLIGLRSSS